MSKLVRNWRKISNWIKNNWSNIQIGKSLYWYGAQSENEPKSESIDTKTYKLVQRLWNLPKYFQRTQKT